MVNPTHISLPVRDRSWAAGMKKEIHRLAVQAGIEQKRIDEIDILASELGSNLAKHATEGEVLAGIVHDKRGKALELIAIDNGPGISDPDRMLQDGVSTTGTLGQGLGAIRRLSDHFELYSQKDWGTVALCRIYPVSSAQPDLKRLSLTVRALVVAKPGEVASGDGYYNYVAPDGSFRLLVADGLGHGIDANLAVREAVTVFRDQKTDSPVEILRNVHALIRKTRGVVAAVVIVDPVRKIWKYCGIGNIATRFSGVHQSKSYLSYNGIVGHNIPTTMNDQELSQQDYQQITLCSDGIRSKWEHARLPDINRQDLIIQAAALYKDFGRRTDDMSIIIGKLPA
jgi:anti-sigma regulatory factor (Ser/Thr protein kinase)